MSPALERRLLRLSVQVFRRGFFMPMWNLREIVDRRLVRALFLRWKRERDRRFLDGR